ncbi:MAG: signal recognition particle-docking protein FtsY [Candidatus Eisenbacteria bacterium]|uniref:Signal recognition particle-docking protein FtsY n=1 Tax=Eiseniibacteriota bacterium TaxID=2212470 RepID=A0A9D6L672_UNCEI|nr:signal recognition particle-docking protein FtsY [Candidatus Eisenbacteria bacterium]MBI3539356.1 signal recognition particle-docking protein FtsY [Candidatus Eisenbacteria bacterium]
MDLWNRFRAGLARTRERLGGPMAVLLRRRGAVDPETRERLDEALLAADVGPSTAERLIDAAEARMRREPELDLGAALERVAAELLGERRARFEPDDPAPGASLWVALIVGVNGVGKTTLAGKLAASLARAGRPTLLVAGDTFRAAAAEQLDVWAGRAGVEIVSARSGADPAAVVHDGVSAALARGTRVALIDTAGRLHTKHNLMAELEKVARVCARLVPGAPHHTLLVLDATLGQNGIAQAREFGRHVPVTSLAVNKLDGTARGGAVLAIVDELKLPVSVVGLGEGIDDWQPFDPEAFARGLFD